MQQYKSTNSNRIILMVILVTTICIMFTSCGIAGDAEVLIESGDYDGAIQLIEEEEDFKTDDELVSLYCDASLQKVSAIAAEGKVDEYVEGLYILDKLISFSAKHKEIYEGAYDFANKISSEKPEVAAIILSKYNNYADSDEKSLQLWDDVAKNHIVSFSPNLGYVLGIKHDGTVQTAKSTKANSERGNYLGYSSFNVKSWKHIRDVVAGDAFAFGLTEDHKIITKYTGYIDSSDYTYNGEVYSNDYFEEWIDIVKIIDNPFNDGIVGLQSDGTVVFCDEDLSLTKCRQPLFDEISSWENIIDIESESYGLIGITADGKVKVATDELDTYEDYEENSLNAKAVAVSEDFFISYNNKTITPSDSYYLEPIQLDNNIRDLHALTSHVFLTDNSDPITDYAVIVVYDNGRVKAFGEKAWIFNKVYKLTEVKGVIDIEMADDADTPFVCIKKDGSFNVVSSKAGEHRDLYSQMEKWGKLKKPTRNIMT